MAGILSAHRLLTATAVELQSLLSNNEITSVQLIEVERYDAQGPKLHAIISLAPRALLLERAADLDNERKAGHLRGPLHGLPILVKVWMLLL